MKIFDNPEKQSNPNPTRYFFLQPEPNPTRKLICSTRPETGLGSGLHNSNYSHTLPPHQETWGGRLEDEGLKGQLIEYLILWMLLTYFSVNDLCSTSKCLS